MIHAGGSIGLHMQSSGDDMNYILSGTGKAICDGVEEKLSAGMILNNEDICKSYFSSIIDFIVNHTTLDI